MLKLITEQIAQDIADAIRSKKWDDETEWWSEDTIKPINFAEEILALPYEEHSPIEIDITQSPHQTITVTPTYNVEFVDGYVYFPESITLDASVVADQGYTAGTLNSTQEVAEWGDGVSFYVSEAGVYHNVTFVYDVTALGSNKTMTIAFNLPDGTRMYHTFTGSGTTTLSLPEGTTFDTIMPPLQGYMPYPSDGRLKGTVLQDYEITFGYTLSQYDVTILFRDSSNHAISTTYRAYLDGNLVESGSGTSVTVAGGYGQTCRVDYDAPSGYRPSGSWQGTISARDTTYTVTFSIINSSVDISFTGEPNSGLAYGDTSSLYININVIGISEENRYDILRDGTVIGSYNVPSLVDDSFTDVFEYRVTQEDIDNGSVTFTLVDSSNGATVDSITLYAKEASPEISVAFSASPTRINIGDDFTQELIIYNSGNVTLTDIVVSPNFGTMNVPSGTSLPLGQSITLTNTVTAQPSMGTLNSSGDSYTIVGDVSVNASPVRGDAPQTAYGTYTIIADTRQNFSLMVESNVSGVFVLTFPVSATGTIDAVENGSVVQTKSTNPGGTVTFDLRSLGSGNHTVTFNYSGDSNYLPYTSNAQQWSQA